MFFKDVHSTNHNHWRKGSSEIINNLHMFFQAFGVHAEMLTKVNTMGWKTLKRGSYFSVILSLLVVVVWVVSDCVFEKQTSLSLIEPKITPHTFQLYSNTRCITVRGHFHKEGPIVGMLCITVEDPTCIFIFACTVCVCVPLTSKQKSCPRMLLWTGLMITSSSILRSRASTALLGLSSDSWERDSFSLGIRWDLRAEKKRERTESLCRVWVEEESEMEHMLYSYQRVFMASAKEESVRMTKRGCFTCLKVNKFSAWQAYTLLYINTCSGTLFLAQSLIDALSLLVYNLKHQWMNEGRKEKSVKWCSGTTINRNKYVPQIFIKGQW